MREALTSGHSQVVAVPCPAAALPVLPLVEKDRALSHCGTVTLHACRRPAPSLACKPPSLSHMPLFVGLEEGAASIAVGCHTLLLAAVDCRLPPAGRRLLRCCCARCFW